MHKAVFLDRDGTLIEDRGHLGHPSQVVFLPDAFDALQRLQEEYLLFIVTNQCGIADGEVSRQEVDGVNEHVVAELAAAGIRITDVYVCPHNRRDGCSCIKPLPHFLYEAAFRYQVDLRRSFTVGDHPHDVELAAAVGAEGIYVLTGHGEKHRAQLSSDSTVVADVMQAAEHILNCRAHRHREANGGDQLDRAAAVIRKGGLVAFPTETVYGLGANAFDARAVARIFEVKERPRFDPLIVHVCAVSQAGEIARDMPDEALELAERFWPGPLTLVLNKESGIPDIVTSGLPTVALRMPDHAIALALIAGSGVPLAGPSANRFGRLSPTSSAHVRDQLGDRVDIVLEGGPCRVGVESTIVSLVDAEPVLLRAGGTPVEAIEELTGPLKRPQDSPDRPSAPGQLPQHYAPRTRLLFVEDENELPDLPRSGLLTLRPTRQAARFVAAEVMSQSGDLREAAANLFAALHRLDAMEIDHIVAVKVPDEGLGLAINDRLRRAAYGADNT